MFGVKSKNQLERVKTPVIPEAEDEARRIMRSPSPAYFARLTPVSPPKVVVVEAEKPYSPEGAAFK